jgi:hypothetical protein
MGCLIERFKLIKELIKLCLKFIFVGLEMGLSLIGTEKLIVFRLQNIQLIFLDVEVICHSLEICRNFDNRIAKLRFCIFESCNILV